MNDTLRWVAVTLTSVLVIGAAQWKAGYDQGELNGYVAGVTDVHGFLACDKKPEAPWTPFAGEGWLGSTTESISFKCGK